MVQRSKLIVRDLQFEHSPSRVTHQEKVRLSAIIDGRVRGCPQAANAPTSENRDRGTSDEVLGDSGASKL